MVCHTMMEIGTTIFDRDLALAIILLAMYMKECGTKTSDMVSVQCIGMIVISHTLAAGKMVYR